MDQRERQESRHQDRGVGGEGAAIGLRHHQRLERRQGDPEAGGERQQQRHHDREVMGDLALRLGATSRRLDPHRDLEQQDIEPGAERHEQPQTEIRRKRELARLGIIGGQRKRAPVHQRHQLVEDVRRDERHRVDRERLEMPPLPERRPELRVGERPARHEERRRAARGRPAEHERRAAEQEGAADHEQEGGGVLEEHDLCVGTLEKPGPGERAAVVEQGHPDPGGRCGRKERCRHAELDVGYPCEADDGAERERHDGIAELDRRAQAGLARVALVAIEACRRQAQPLEERGVDHDRDRHRDRIAPELVRPEKPRDEEPKREVQARVDEEGGDDRHGPIRKQACAARAPPCFERLARVPVRMS
ncbi:MAG: hypothetical protein ACJ8BE_20510 [Microvirga sp.]